MKLFVVISIFFFSTLFSYSQTGFWEELNPTTNPVSRYGHDMAPIGNNKVLLFGGFVSTSGLRNDTWIYDLSTDSWIKLELEIKPSKRFNHKLVQIAENKVLLFGGDTSSIFYCQDTWIFDLNDMGWVEMNPGKSPPGREGFGFAKLSENKAVLFGGNSGKKIHDRDTWIYDYMKNTWEQVFVDISFRIPRGREKPMMCQIDEGKALLYGGWAFEVLNDTWLFEKKEDGKFRWEELKPEQNILPIQRAGMAIISYGYVILFGGYRYYDGYNDTWLFSLKDTNWRLVGVDSKPPKRGWLSLTKIGSNNKALLFIADNEKLTVERTWLFELDPISTVENDTNIDSSMIEYEFVDNSFSLINYPNPFIDNVIIRFFLEKTSKITLTLTNNMGVEISRILNDIYYDQGMHQIEYKNNDLQSGIYYCKIQTETESETIKMVVVR